jgi:histone deacetylase complex regulatory component SIN3
VTFGVMEPKSSQKASQQKKKFNILKRYLINLKVLCNFWKILKVYQQKLFAIVTSPKIRVGKFFLSSRNQ